MRTLQFISIGRSVLTSRVVWTTLSYAPLFQRADIPFSKHRHSPLRLDTDAQGPYMHTWPGRLLKQRSLDDTERECDFIFCSGRHFSTISLHSK